MSINVIERIHINGSAKSIAAYMFNPQNDPEWISGILEVKSISSLPAREGTEVHRIAHFMGKDVDYILKVNELEEDKSMSMESIKGPFPMKVDYIIEPIEVEDSNLPEGSNCSVMIKIMGESKGYFFFIDRLLALMVSHNIKGDLKKLKEIFEGEEFDDDL